MLVAGVIKAWLQAAVTLLVLAAAGLAPSAQAAANSSDAELLLAMKATFSNGAEVLSSWKPGTDTCGFSPIWEGVLCSGGSVTDL